MSVKCGICGSDNIFCGGSWSPAKCNNCGAIEIAQNHWVEEIKDEERENYGNCSKSMDREI
jgi:hypothetical protein